MQTRWLDKSCFAESTREREMTFWAEDIETHTDRLRPIRWHDGKGAKAAQQDKKALTRIGALDSRRWLYLGHHKEVQPLEGDA